LNSDEAAKLFAQLVSQPHSLVADLHLLRLAALRDQRDLWVEAERIAAHLLDPFESQARFDCFRAVLKFGRLRIQSLAGPKVSPVDETRLHLVSRLAVARIRAEHGRRFAAADRLVRATHRPLDGGNAGPGSGLLFGFSAAKHMARWGYAGDRCGYVATQDFHGEFRECEFPLEELEALEKILKAISIPLGSSVGAFDGGSGLIRIYHGCEGWIDFFYRSIEQPHGMRFSNLSARPASDSFHRRPLRCTETSSMIPF
jgi:hypothetical protein